MSGARHIRALSAVTPLLAAAVSGTGQAGAEKARPVIGSYYAGWNSATYAERSLLTARSAPFVR